MDYVPTDTHSSQGESQLYIFEDNEAMIKMIIKGRSPTMMRHVSRTDRVALDCLCDRIDLEPKIQIKYVYTKNQFADILPTEVSREMSGITFCVYSTYVFFRHILAQAISKVLSLKSESAL